MTDGADSRPSDGQNSIDRARRASMARLASSPVPPGIAILRGSNHSTRNSPVSSPIRPSILETNSISSNSSGGPAGFALENDDETLKTVAKHVPQSSSSLLLPGGDVTRDIVQSTKPSRLKKSRSLSNTSSFLDGERRGSVASSINVPGGFRRDFLLRKHERYGHKMVRPNLFTRNFLEFLSVYGHFAGEDLEDEDYLACNYELSSDSTLDEETPLIGGRQREKKGKASTLKSFFLLLKSFIGTGVLFLPKGFYNGGVLFSCVTLIVFGILSWWCYLILVQSKVATGLSSFGEIGLKLYGKTMERLILFSIVVSQIGFVAAYMVFTSSNLEAFANSVFGHGIASMNFLTIVQVLILIPLSLIRNITKLSLASLCANAFIFVGLFLIVCYAGKHLVDNGIAEGVVLFNDRGWSLFVGVAIFAFEGIGLIIPVHESMANPSHFPKILLAVILTCCGLFIGIGALGYLSYGHNTNTVVILNLPQGSILVQGIQLLYALAIMLSEPLQLFPAIRIIETRLFKRAPSGKYDPKVKWLKNIFRMVFVAMTGIIAIYGSENLDQFVSFVGCFACIPLVYMYSPMLHYKSVAQTTLWKAFDVVLVLVGGIAMVYTTWHLLRDD
ncbi:Vacuolar amino acid transporter 4 [Komagataella phaffii CBS 7435]|uniref:Vacuolar transporter, exports large neutral amino acids from the vacuole n=2 Tax=Komagataella phaffii TaxID=460519 RepID=C4R239_KOMPG|nr:Vacuolar transporter, exports large neutral amino acids from the vacuole [Komagataella phaffii GS115]AOA62828.1 GQ67_00985T0 [Komagataella phaffii]CAH2447890.1 Vacuolar amino acid transporter 4 [Komagataella phaffii CBS 7435]AOA67152.1 GQ68_00404T0 [Komagataella phaffii GS115]CAY69563.1 Vacuolar transporter, exports large neutral amino acids from the vacuole [Komagataella phaffii GS115]CCA38057.1 Vacuolar amino acid transporter 4 [Komagataella phaffii CBS 7435]